MKTFTARDLGRKRGEIRQAVKDGGCIVQYKHSDRTLEMECVMVPMCDWLENKRHKGVEQKYLAMLQMNEALARKLRNDPRKQCECIVWDGTTCLRPAAWLTEKNELLCDLHGGLCKYPDPIGYVGEPSTKGIEIVNTKDNPYIVT